MDEKKTDNSWIWILIVIAGALLLGYLNREQPCSGSCCDVLPEDRADCLDANRMSNELNDIMNGSSTDDVNGSESFSGCPDGCRTSSISCVIKGNISFESEEKIYHMPGDKYYSATSIDPAYGERWFCTESEAKANGWRHALE